MSASEEYSEHTNGRLESISMIDCSSDEESELPLFSLEAHKRERRQSTDWGSQIEPAGSYCSSLDSHEEARKERVVPPATSQPGRGCGGCLGHHSDEICTLL